VGPTGINPASQVTFVALVIGMSTLIMWFSARIIGLREVGLGRSFVATLGVSILMGMGLTLMGSLSPGGMILMGGAAFIGSVMVIRFVFQTQTFPAVLVLIVNIMVQILMVSFYYRAVLPPGSLPGAGPAPVRPTPSAPPVKGP
jgi:hypothetical protein